jgi:hypothetical protein
VTHKERPSGDESSLTSESEICHDDLPMRQRPVKSPVLRLGLHLLKLLLLVPKMVLLLVITHAVVVPLGVVILVGGVKLLPLGAVGDEVDGVAARKAAPRRSPPLLAEPVQSSELSRQQGDLIIRDALVLLIRSCTQERQGKVQSR